MMVSIVEVSAPCVQASAWDEKLSADVEGKGLLLNGRGGQASYRLGLGEGG